MSRQLPQDVNTSKRGTAANSEAPGNAPVTLNPSALDPRWIAVGALLLLAGIWSYWPTLAGMVGQWVAQPDYSHGFLVLPLSVIFLWLRREEFPTASLNTSLWGGALLLFVGILRIAAGKYFLSPLDGWTIPLWVAGVVWLLFGWPCLRWSLPAIVFLWFMVPIPYAGETMLSVPLQKLATKLSTAVLVMLGQPALSEGNVIWLDNQQLNVAEACSGLRIFVGMFALSCAFALFSRWAWWQKTLAIVATLPIAILANVSRVVVTGLLYRYTSSELARHFSHDLSALVMIPFAAGLFWLFLTYLDRLFPEAEQLTAMDMGASLRT